MRRYAALLVLLALAGCGGASLSQAERSRVDDAEQHIASTVADGSDYAATLRDVDRLIALYRSKPDADYDGRSMREVLQDAASDLEPYRPELAHRLDRAAS